MAKSLCRNKFGWLNLVFSDFYVEHACKYELGVNFYYH